ncbi:hypothetical protein QYE76_019301 [Lolium multiflorum]|uniref:F-box domain-containing protein n=1 Tax=Lolium multiflorum TaxID=4521 RepID=A0AAD8R695_LOLMU|nr:hypothetical protein QYE76_019301 [Lolium multiflorum]
MCREAPACPIRALREGAGTGVAGASIGLEIASALFGTSRCEPIFDAGPQNAIGAAGGDALTSPTCRTTARPGPERRSGAAGDLTHFIPAVAHYSRSDHHFSFLSISNRADPIPSMSCVDAKRLRSSTRPGSPVSKVIHDDNTSSSPAPATLLDNEDLLREILLRLPPKPSSLPLASLVCTRWRNILSDPQFLGCFRKYHQKPPLLGFFVGTHGMRHNFLPIADTKSNCVPAERFAVPKCRSPYHYWDLCGCRHGLVLLIP